MSTTKANLNDIELQELKDFQTTIKILNCIFSKDGRQIDYYKQPQGSVYDMKMVINDKYRYHLEIKERQQDMEKYNTLPLSVQKYCNIKDTLSNYKKPAKAIYISLLNHHLFYIFDLEKIDLNNCIIRNWAINDVEYSDAPTIVQVPTIFIPISQAVCKGSFIELSKNNHIIAVDNADNKQTTTQTKSTQTTTSTTV